MIKQLWEVIKYVPVDLSFPYERCLHKENKYYKKQFMIIDMFLNDLQVYSLMKYEWTYFGL